MTKGLQFNSVWSVGNAKQIGVEDVLQFMDENFDPEKDSRNALPAIFLGVVIAGAIVTTLTYGVVQLF